VSKKFEDTTWVIRSRKSKDRQHNDKTKKDNFNINNDPQNTTQKTKDRGTRTSLKFRGKCYVNRKSKHSSCSTNGTRRVTLVTNPLISHE
jgi:hypothetical protein